MLHSFVHGFSFFMKTELTHFTENLGPTQPKIFTVCLFIEKVGKLCLRKFFEKKLNYKNFRGRLKHTSNLRVPITKTSLIQRNYIRHPLRSNISEQSNKHILRSCLSCHLIQGLKFYIKFHPQSKSCSLCSCNYFNPLYS